MSMPATRHEHEEESQRRFDAIAVGWAQMVWDLDDDCIALSDADLVEVSATAIHV
jgi:hypothetical protein